MRKVEVEIPDGYVVRFASENDIDAIMTFFKEHWKADHIFATNREYFEYEFCKKDEVCFVLLCDSEGQIKGILGYIPYGPKSEPRNLFMVTWKVIDSDAMFAGVSLLNYLVENANCKNIYTIGLNKGTINIYKYLKLNVVEMEHYYLINQNIPQKLAQVGGEANSLVESKDIKLIELTDKLEVEALWPTLVQNKNVEKTLEYLTRRYFENPIYLYRAFWISEKSGSTIVILREQEYEGSKILRFIDAVGNVDSISLVPFALQSIIENEGFEYLDMYAYGLDKESLLSHGWNIVDGDDTIIPNYFKPFEKKNITIYAMHEKEVSPVIFKGDGDQDRP